MTHPFGDPLLIVNPMSGRSGRDVVSRLRRALDAHGIETDLALTEGPGHATEIARRAVEADGRGYLVAVGGDGTIHEVVNGVVDATTGRTRGDDPVVGAVGAGSGSDLVRTFGLDRSPEIIADHLTTDATMRIDLGRVQLVGRDGAETTLLFANIAQAGYGGAVVAQSARLPRLFGAARYPVAILGSVARFRLVEAAVTVDQGEVRQPLSNVVVANGQFFGGGLKVAPRALPASGRFNVQVWGGRPVDVLRGARQLKTGAHLSREDVREWQSATVEVTGDRPLIIEADGEVLGATPARFDVLPGVLRFKL